MLRDHRSLLDFSAQSPTTPGSYLSERFNSTPIAVQFRCCRRTMVNAPNASMKVIASATRSTVLPRGSSVMAKRATTTPAIMTGIVQLECLGGFIARKVASESDRGSFVTGRTNSPCSLLCRRQVTVKSTSPPIAGHARPASRRSACPSVATASNMPAPSPRSTPPPSGPFSRWRPAVSASSRRAAR